MNLPLSQTERIESRAATKRSMALLHNLGRATRRGIRKCPGCGTLNGTRTLSCKNNKCTHVFRERAVARRNSANHVGSASSAIKATKVLTGSDLHLFSIQILHRGDRSVVDSYGFVQLPLVQDACGNPIEHVHATVYALMGQCHVAGCARRPVGGAGGVASIDEETGSLLKTDELDCCVHVTAAIICDREASASDAVMDFNTPSGKSRKVFTERCTAVALCVSQTYVDALPLPEDIRSELLDWISSTSRSRDTSPPIVQRIVDTPTMIVRCAVDERHPFGFLHLTVTGTARRGSRQRYRCSCSSMSLTAIDRSSYAGAFNSLKCIHLYACVCAFLSDERLAVEFKSLIQLVTKSADTHEETTEIQFNGDVEFVSEVVQDSDAHENLILRSSPSEEDVDEVECSDVIPTSDQMDFQPGEDYDVDDLVTIEPSNEENSVDARNCLESESFVDIEPTSDLESVCEQNESSSIQVEVKKTPFKPVFFIRKLNSGGSSSGGIKKDSSSVISASNACVTGGGGSSVSRVADDPAQQATLTPSDCVDEGQVQLSFIDWLSGVTERINNSMHYQFDGKPDTLVFYVAQKLFDCLQTRLSGGSRKKRLPNFMCNFERRDALPVGTFTRCVWHINNIIHLKQIFDTPQIQLDVIRNFAQNRDGTYEHVSSDPALCSLASSSSSPISSQGHASPTSFHSGRPIRPSQLKTFLKVGNTSPTQSDPTPFIIEWTANVLPLTQVGELRLTFQYGHQRNGQRVDFVDDVNM